MDCEKGVVGGGKLRLLTDGIARDDGDDVIVTNAIARDRRWFGEKDGGFELGFCEIDDNNVKDWIGDCLIVVVGVFLSWNGGRKWVVKLKLMVGYQNIFVGLKLYWPIPVDTERFMWLHINLTYSSLVFKT